MVDQDINKLIERIAAEFQQIRELMGAPVESKTDES